MTDLSAALHNMDDRRKSRRDHERHRRAELNVLVAELAQLVDMSSDDRKSDKCNVLGAVLRHLKDKRDSGEPNWDQNQLAVNGYLSLLDAAILVISLQGMVLEAHQQTEAIFGCKAEELASRQLSDYLTAESAIVLQRILTGLGISLSSSHPIPSTKADLQSKQGITFTINGFLREKEKRIVFVAVAVPAIRENIASTSISSDTRLSTLSPSKQNNNVPATKLSDSTSSGSKKWDSNTWDNPVVAARPLLAALLTSPSVRSSNSSSMISSPPLNFRSRTSTDHISPSTSNSTIMCSDMPSTSSLFLSPPSTIGSSPPSTMKTVDKRKRERVTKGAVAPKVSRKKSNANKNTTTRVAVPKKGATAIVETFPLSEKKVSVTVAPPPPISFQTTPVIYPSTSIVDWNMIGASTQQQLIFNPFTLPPDTQTHLFPTQYTEAWMRAEQEKYDAARRMMEKERELQVLVLSSMQNPFNNQSAAHHP